MSEEPATPNATVAAMRLRPQPKPVLRLSRNALIGLSAGVSLSVAAAITYAVLPHDSKPTEARAAETAPTHSRPSADVLSKLPKDYTNVPKLGPPLPGDFGKVMLNAQQTSVPAMANASDPSIATLAAGASSTEPAMSGTADQARVSARTSQLFFPQSASAPAPSQDASALPSNPLATLAAWSPPAVPEAKSEPYRKRAFLDQASDPQTVSSERLSNPASPYLLLAGSVVPAALITGIRSDIPGQVLAQVTQDVRDSVNGQYLLIPKGSRLIGQYDNAVSFGQSRLLLTWSRLILPNGKSLILNTLSAADAKGFAGLQDTTNYHWAGIVNAAAVSTLLGMGTQTGSAETDSALIRAIRSGAGDSINRAGQAIVERQLTVQPTLTLRPGLPVRVILTKDLILEPYGA